MTTLEGFQKMLRTSDKPVFVLWGAGFCAPCKVIKPHFLQASKDCRTISFLTLDVEEEPDIALEYNISRIPVIKVFVGGAEKEQLNGANEGSLKRLVEKYRK